MADTRILKIRRCTEVKGEAPGFPGASPLSNSQLLSSDSTEQSFRFLVQNPGRRSADLVINQFAI
jgi:hypothetical protein